MRYVVELLSVKVFTFFLFLNEMFNYLFYMYLGFFTFIIAKKKKKNYTTKILKYTFYPYILV